MPIAPELLKQLAEKRQIAYAAGDRLSIYGGRQPPTSSR